MVKAQEGMNEMAAEGVVYFGDLARNITEISGARG